MRFFILILALSLASCSKSKGPSTTTSAQPTSPETFPISNTKMKNCHFKDANPTYSFGSTITPNPIICDEGVARSVQVLNPTPLPSGLQFVMSELSLTGTAGEKVNAAPYQFYLENEAGYVILKMLLTVK